jgi:hypothetical protein
VQTSYEAKIDDAEAKCPLPSPFAVERINQQGDVVM